MRNGKGRKARSKGERKGKAIVKNDAVGRGQGEKRKINGRGVEYRCDTLHLFCLSFSLPSALFYLHPFLLLLSLSFHLYSLPFPFPFLFLSLCFLCVFCITHGGGEYVTDIPLRELTFKFKKIVTTFKNLFTISGLYTYQGLSKHTTFRPI
jgi:hypothetical protein